VGPKTWKGRKVDALRTILLIAHLAALALMVVAFVAQLSTDRRPGGPPGAPESG
jgi:hypothetical protein